MTTKSRRLTDFEARTALKEFQQEDRPAEGASDSPEAVFAGRHHAAANEPSRPSSSPPRRSSERPS